MKRKSLMVLMAVSLVVALLAGCGTATNEGTVRQTVTQVEADVPEAESQETESVNVSEEFVTEEESEVAEEITPEQTEELEVTAEPTETAEPEPQYTYTDLSQTMYAKQSVNVRSLPSTDGEKLGGFSTAQEVTVTGQCNETSWYRIDYNGSVGYVSNNYLVTEKPVEQPSIPLAQEQLDNEEYPDLSYNLYDVTFDGTSFTWYTDGNPDGYQSALTQIGDILTSQNLQVSGSPFEWNSTHEDLGRYKNKGTYSEQSWMFVSKMTLYPTFN